MSGGSFDHLYTRTPADLMSGDYDEHLREMALELDGIGGEKAAADLRRMLADVVSTRSRLAHDIARLEHVMFAVEWWRSGDYGEERARAAAGVYERDYGRPGGGL